MTVITKYDDFITKGNIYYKMRRLLLTATAQRGIYNFFNWYGKVINKYMKDYDKSKESSYL